MCTCVRVCDNLKLTICSSITRTVKQDTNVHESKCGESPVHVGVVTTPLWFCYIDRSIVTPNMCVKYGVINRTLETALECAFVVLYMYKVIPNMGSTGHALDNTR